ncbi:hypothetical protein LY90DRAFT_629380 [Neocallimastix californiae]|uniref:Uncharacterized protein n=1 Tax=Neocallimastix californiae TaxID=1754190 RepID=A0A1Y2AUM6_9FUNG|nr:hypothetical protein LY90DRAFT_629380 [Neocallimastix californiae]|eukprot:ORY26186.1 hypothetical protein LY90DRAFT_629380 [Neocallimastix californiae]
MKEASKYKKHIKYTTMLFRIFLAIYACFASFLRNGYTRTININSDEIPDELIYHFNISNSFIKENSEVPERCCDFDFTMFCKDNVCVHLEEKIIKPFIELPDKNGYVHRYILEPYAHSYGNFILEYNESNNNDTMFLLNRCDNIYTKRTIFSNSILYSYCGRMVGEYCTEDADCSFKNCQKNKKCSSKNCEGMCSSIHYEPSDSDTVTLGIQKLGLGVALSIILIIIICCCCCCVISYKDDIINNIKKEKFFKI